MHTHAHAHQTFILMAGQRLCVVCAWALSRMCVYGRRSIDVRARALTVITCTRLSHDACKTKSRCLQD